jgi:hypothetical protein
MYIALKAKNMKLIKNSSLLFFFPVFMIVSKAACIGNRKICNNMKGKNDETTKYFTSYV